MSKKTARYAAYGENVETGERERIGYIRPHPSHSVVQHEVEKYRKGFIVCYKNIRIRKVKK